MRCRLKYGAWMQVLALAMIAVPETSCQSGDRLSPVSTPFSSGSGSGSGSGSMLAPDQVSCQFQPSDLNFEVFTTTEDLIRSLLTSCSNANLEAPPTLTIAVQGQQVSRGNTLLVEHFSVGENLISVTACGTTCDSSSVTYDTNITISRSTSRLFPFNHMATRHSMSAAGDGYFSIHTRQDNPVPFFSDYHDVIYVYANGYITFGQPYSSYSPIPFPYGTFDTPIAAPFWADFQAGEVFCEVYEGRGSSVLSESIFTNFNERFSSSDRAALGMPVDFEAEWVAVFTWENAVPFYDRGRTERISFQLVLSTDYVRTFGFYIYGDTHDLSIPTWVRVVIGYDSRDGTHHRSLSFSSWEDFSRIDNAQGNTGRNGEWLFDFTSADPNAESRCLNWAREQNTEAGEVAIPSSLHCPCTKNQARRDFQFWFAYYWGLSRQNCAIVLFSETNGTIECCYDSSGALLVGPHTGGGTYLKYNPLFSFHLSLANDLNPYQDCCVNSDRCQRFYQIRQYDDCSEYTPPALEFTYGDPHFTTIDNLNYTFNGIGEYIFVRTPVSIDFHLQGRLTKYDDDSDGTVLSAVVVKQGNLPTVQVSRGDDEMELNVYVGGIAQQIKSGDSPVVVSNSGISSTNIAGGVTNLGGLAAVPDMMFVQSDENGNVVVTTDTGASISVGNQRDFLRITVEIPASFVNMTRGLLGLFNGNPNDDFHTRTGEILEISADNDRDVYQQFGLEWHLNESESFFNYSIDGTSYSAINDGYRSYVPTYSEDVVSGASAEIKETCMNDKQCIYDYVVTGSAGVGVSTYNISMDNQNTVVELENSPPTISGNFTFFADYGVLAYYQYSTSDPDGGGIEEFILKSPVPSGFTMDTSISNTIIVTWPSPDQFLPDHALQLFSRDTEGGVTVRFVSVVLCACLNGGTCLKDNRVLNRARFDDNGHYKWACNCSDFYGGSSCETDMRGCGNFSTCPDPSMCRDDPTLPSGYACDQCSDGFELVDNKCSDVDECSGTYTCGANEVCRNTEGSFQCDCASGYSNRSSGMCEDIDECTNGIARCSQTCDNQPGSFTCSCLEGYMLNSDGRSCGMRACTSNVCSSGLDCVVLVSGSLRCVCPPGQMCSGTCEGTMTDISTSGGQTCEDCASNVAGIRCQVPCNCGNNGICNSTSGCVCSDGWTGVACNTELNEHTPSFSNSTPSSITVRWDLSHSLSSSSLIAITATDADPGPASGGVIYSLLRSAYPLPTGVSDGTGIFQIDSTSGQLSLLPSSSPLSQLSQNVSKFFLTIQASDGGVPARTAQHTLTVIPIPVPEFENGSIIAEIQEELKIGTTILDLSCSEIGRPSGTTQVTLTGLNHQNLLVEKDMAVFHLVIARRIDYEQLPADIAAQGYMLNATCSNTYGQSDSIMIRLAISNIDDNDFDFERDFYSAVVAENATLEQEILTARVIDRDIPSADIYYSTNSTVFRFLSATSSIIRLTASLDRELADRYPVALMAEYNSSGEAYQASSLLVVTISDINDNTPMFVSPGYFVNNVTTRANIGDHVVRVLAADADIGTNSDITYSISQSQQFSINSSTGDIAVDMNLFLTTYEFTVYAEDGGAISRTAETLVVVTVQPYPNALSLTIPESIVNEDIPIGSRIARAEIQITDFSRVVINDTSPFVVEFDISNGSHADTFIISSDTGEIFTLSSLDYDAIATSYNIPILAQVVQYPDLVVTRSAVVRVNNIDDNPPRFMPQFYAAVAEQFTAAGTSILQVTARDPDGLAPVRFFIETTENVPFAVSSTSGVITAQEELSTAIDYRFRVIARDGGAQESTAVVFVSITRPLSVSPVFTRTQFRFTLPENSRPGTHVGTVAAFARNNISLDYIGHLGYRASNPTSIDFSNTSLPMLNASDNLFNIDSTSGNISTQGSFEFDIETRMEFFFYVEVYNLDDDTVYDYATVEVELQDVNDNAPVFDQSLYTRVITTAQPTGSVVLSVSATDRDSGDLNGRVTYSIASPAGGGVTGFALNSSSGAVSVSNSTLIPGDHYITVVATDGGSPALSDSARVYVAVIPDIPDTIEFSETVYSFELAEDATPPVTLGMVRVVGVNTSATLVNATYSTPNVTDCFNVRALTGEVILTCTSIDRERISSYELTVQGGISSGTVALGTVQISIQDINDNPPDFSLDVYTKVIDNRFGNVVPVLQVQADDADIGASGMVMYQIAPNALFRINSSSGEIFLTNGTIEAGDYRVTVYAVDMGADVQLSSSALVLICVTRAYPQSLNFQTTMFNVSENIHEPYPVGTVVLVTNGGNVIDPNDFPGNLDFSIVGGDAMDSFSIDASSGLVTALTRFDREEAASHVVEILANFTQFSVIPLNHVQASFTVRVEDENEAPAMDNAFYEATIDDSTETGFVVANISGTDSDAGQNAMLHFSLLGAPNSMFGVRVSLQSLPQTFGEIYVVDQASLVAGTYTFDVVAIDQGNPSMMSAPSPVTIDIEHSIPDEIYFELTEYLFHTPETVLGGSPIITPMAIGNVSVLPKTPALDSLEFRISGGNGMRYFTIDGSGVISTRNLQIDREAVSAFTLNVTAHLPGSPFLYAETMVTIIVDDVNDNSPEFDIADSIYPRVGLSTDRLDSSILNISASDADTGSNAQIVYSIQSILYNSSNSVSDALFMVNPQTGEVFVPFMMSISIGSYLFEFRATDQGRPPRFATAHGVVIVQQPAPQSLQFSQRDDFFFQLQENAAAATMIGTITLQDFPVYLENRLRFSILNRSVPFSIVPSSGGIQNVRSIDFETEQNFTFTVQVVLDDSNRVPSLYLTATTAVTIAINDVNDNPPVFISFPDVITQTEERPTPEVVHTILANDMDSGANGRLNYAILTTGIDDIVSINNQTGEITAAAGLDRENSRQGADHSLIIQVCDSGNPARCVQDSVVFRLLDINDNSPILTTGFTYQVVERTPFNTRAFNFRGSDPDEGNNGRLSFYFNHPLRSIPFWMSRGGRVVYNYIEIDYEETPLYILSINVTDRGNPPRVTTYANITFVVQDLPDSVPQFTEASYRADINPAVSQNDPVAQVEATDADIPASNDSLAYSITGIRQTGNRGVTPVFHVNQTGGIYTSRAQVFWPEAQFEVTILVYDQSRFNLSSTATVTVSVVPEPLAFTQAAYSAFVPEDLSRGSLVASLTIQNLSFSSDVTYSAQGDLPGQFSTNGNGLRTVNVTLTSDLDREVVDTWQIRVTARRNLPSRGREEATTVLTVHVQDVNDQRPIFREITDQVTVTEGVTQDTFVLLSDATDSDIGENGRLTYSFIDEPAVFPFRINGSTGMITTSGKIDYEAVSSYNISVLARDHGTPARENRVSYTINVININDNHPRFAKPAYFGEVYARAPVNTLVSHTQLIVSDLDDVLSQEPLSFNIRQTGPNADSSYQFQVTSTKPHRVQVVNIPASANDESDLLTFIIEVTDTGGLIAEVPFYLSIFTSSNLVTFVLEGNIDFATLLSCSLNRTSLCVFRDTVASVTKSELDTIRGITFYNNSATEVSRNGVRSVVVDLYGWYGPFQPRGNRGELESSDVIAPIAYIDYDRALFETVAKSQLFFVLTFSVNLQVETVTTAEPTAATEAPAGSSFLFPIIGVVVGVVVAVVVLVVLVILVCVLGKRKDDKPKKKSTRRPSDPYERSINRLRHKHRDLRNSSEDIGMQSVGASDLAYETMYDDDDIVDTKQTMPWFDPNYLASNKNEYDGDNEETLRRAQTERQKIPSSMRATVDGDARRSRRYSSDESAAADQSVTELDQSEYLQGYQTSAPMKPGQRMSELDMFASQRTGEDPNKPHRPTLDAAQGYWQSQTQESSAAPPKQRQSLPKHQQQFQQHQHQQQFQQQQHQQQQRQPPSSGKPRSPGPSVAQPHPKRQPNAARAAPGSPPQPTNPFRQVPLRKVGARGGNRGPNNGNA